ncbi:MAG: hypothetical protein GTO40_30170 [Deltaproteobacteria bacterium]|nr:hypothetical protein [Deltaproteobacteria bacterium]
MACKRVFSKLVRFGIFGTFFIFALAYDKGIAGSFPEPLLIKLPIAAGGEAESGFSPFSRFRGRAGIVLGVRSDGDCFDLTVGFALGTGSDGIDPVTEPVTLSVGGENWLIPPGSFKRDDLGRYRAEPLIGKTQLKLLILHKGDDQFELRAIGAPARLPAAVPLSFVPVRLRIGNDGGATDVLAETQACA